MPLAEDTDPRMILGNMAQKIISGFKSSPISVISIIIANLSILIGVLFLGWSLPDMVLLYWFESAIIGFFVILKIASANGPSFTPAKAGTIVFFLIHYGMFMFAHFMVIAGLILPLLSGGNPEAWNFTLPANFPLLAGTLPLFLSHALSFATNYVGKKEYANANIGGLMTSPYGRIIAMQVFVIASAFLLSMIIDIVPSQFIIYAYCPFIVIGKTFFDLSAHLSERNAGEGESGKEDGTEDSD